MLTPLISVTNVFGDRALPVVHPMARQEQALPTPKNFYRKGFHKTFRLYLWTTSGVTLNKVIDLINSSHLITHLISIIIYPVPNRMMGKSSHKDSRNLGRSGNHTRKWKLSKYLDYVIPVRIYVFTSLWNMLFVFQSHVTMIQHCIHLRLRESTHRPWMLSSLSGCLQNHL